VKTTVERAPPAGWANVARPLPEAVILDAYQRSLAAMLEGTGAAVVFEPDVDSILVNLPGSEFLWWYPLRGLVERWRENAVGDPEAVGTRPVGSTREVAELARKMLAKGERSCPALA
jgi:hypothetical protein